MNREFRCNCPVRSFRFCECEIRSGRTVGGLSGILGSVSGCVGRGLKPTYYTRTEFLGGTTSAYHQTPCNTNTPFQQGVIDGVGILVDVCDFGSVAGIAVFGVLGMERRYCTSDVRVSPVVFGVECRVYCCDNRRRFAGCVEDWKVIKVGSVKWQR